MANMNISSFHKSKKISKFPARLSGYPEPDITFDCTDGVSTVIQQYENDMDGDEDKIFIPVEKVTLFCSMLMKVTFGDKFQDKWDDSHPRKEE